MKRQIISIWELKLKVIIISFPTFFYQEISKFHTFSPYKTENSTLFKFELLFGLQKWIQNHNTKIGTKIHENEKAKNLENS